jgi:hypothetical protein
MQNVEPPDTYFDTAATTLINYVSTTKTDVTIADHHLQFPLHVLVSDGGQQQQATT